MTETAHPYHCLAQLLSYPTKDFKEIVALCDRSFRKYPEVALLLAPFKAHVATQSLSDLEELYTRTFDVQALCHLDIGFVMFGEDYKRGSFLVHMKQEHAAAGNDLGVELPDYLPYILTLLARMNDQTRAMELVRWIVLPSLDKILKKFTDETHVYRKVIEAIQCILQADYGAMENLPTVQKNNDFWNGRPAPGQEVVL